MDFGISERTIMSGPYWTIDGYDRKAEFWILRERLENGALGFRDEYLGLVCNDCGRVDELRALKRGISIYVHTPTRATDYLISDDRFKVVSSRMKKVLESITGVEVRFFQLPEDPNFWVLYPVKLFKPPKSTRFYGPTERPREGDVFQIRSKACTGCGRYVEVTWREEWFRVPRPVKLAGVFLDRTPTASIIPIVDDEVRLALRKAKLSGWRATRLKD
jgi:hypothetical protein